ncbi:MAG: phage major capsid protein, partial [Bryobacteraceae bacterium]|nr:phage major capsid protein [Bryobacteraceae bacterium]
DGGFTYAGSGGASIGAKFVGSSQYKSMIQAGQPVSGKFLLGSTFEQKDITGNTYPVMPMRIAGVQDSGSVPLRVRDLIPVGRTSSNLVSFVRELSFTNNAAPQWSPVNSPLGEGALKAQSDFTFVQVESAVRTLAHHVPVSKQVVQDDQMLRSFIDTRMLYGLKLVEEQQLLFGDGTQANLEGIAVQAQAYDVTLDGQDDTKIDKIGHALFQVRRNKSVPTAIILNPADWHDIKLVKDAEKRYMVTNPHDMTTPRLFGIPVVESDPMTAGEFLTGDFRRGAQIWDREDATVEVGYVSDQFTRNLFTILCEERIALATYKPDAFVYGQF